MAVHLSVIDRSGSIEFAGAGRLFLCPSSNIHRVDSCARTHARGHSLAPVSAPVGFVARGFAGILYPLPSLMRGAFKTCEGTTSEGQECVCKEGHARRLRRLLGEGGEDTRERVKIGGGRASATRRPEP